MACLNLMPESDMESVAHTIEGSGPFDPTVLATTPKKKKARKTKRSHKRRKSFANTWSDTSLNHSESGPCIEEASIPPVFPEEGDNDATASTDQVVVAVPFLTQTSFQKIKMFVWSFSIDPDLQNFLVDDNNYQDEPLIRCIVQESLWRAKHGAKKTSWDSVMSLLANQKHHFENVFEGASMITIQHRYERYINLAKRSTSERDKHNQEQKSEDEEPDTVSSRTWKQMIKQGILEMYKDVQLFEEEVKMVKEQMRRRKLWKRLQQKKYV